MKNIKQITILVIVVLLVIFIFNSQYSSFDAIELDTTLPEVVSSKTIIGDEVDDDAESITISEVGNRKLVLDPTTTNITLLEGSKELLSTMATDSDSSILLSPIVVDYKQSSTSAFESFYAYDDSIEKGNYTIDIVDNGAIVTYSMGEEIVPIDKLPKAIEEKRFDDIISTVSDEDGQYLKSFYTYSSDRKAYIRPPEIKPQKVTRLYEILYDEAGYTTDDFNEDSKIMDSGATEENEPINVTIPVKFTLSESGDFSVSVVLDDVTSSGVKEVNSIAVLPGLLSSDDGYFLIPDGSGAIVDTTTHKVASRYEKEYSPIKRDVLVQEEDILSENLTLPVFANESILGVIEDGASSVSLNVDMTGNQNLIFPSINYQYDILYELNSTGAGVNLSSPATSGVVEFLYITDGSEKTYFDHAKEVQDHYLDKFSLNYDSNIEPKINLELIGAFNYTDYFLGVPYNAIESLTTFEQAQMIEDELGLNTNIIYHGWQKDALKSSPITTKSNGKMGTPSENYSYAINAVKVDEEFMDKFNLNKDFVYGIEGDVNSYYQIYNSTFEENHAENKMYYISPSKLSSTMDSFTKKFDYSDKLTINDLGSMGFGDYHSNHIISPIYSEDIINTILIDINENYELTLNAPILERGFSSDNIIGLPQNSSNNDVFDYDIPFVQLVYGGVIPNSNEPINLNDQGNIQASLLHSFETKSDLDFMLSYDDSTQLKNSDFNKFYAVNYSFFKDIIIQSNDAYETFLSDIDNADIANHEVIENGLTKVSYKNGKVAYFNYNNVTLKVDGISVEPFSYTIK